MSQRLPSDFKEITSPTSCLEGVLAELINPADLTGDFFFFLLSE